MRDIEPGCREMFRKQSLTWKVDAEYARVGKLLESVIGPNYGLTVFQNEDFKLEAVKPDLFSMMFVYNPKNFLYAKVSMKQT